MSEEFRSKTVKGKIKDKDNGEREYTASVTVAKRPTQVVYSGDAAGQYSDPATLTATLTDNGGGTLQGTLLSGKTVGFTLGTQSTSATTNASGVASVPLALDKAPGGTTVATSFAGDTEYAASSDSDAFTIGKEDATLAFDPDNPAAVKVAIAGGASGPFSLLFDEQELVPDEGCPADPDNCPGDIGKATVAMKLVPVGPGGSVTGTCTPGSVTGSGYGAMLPVTCTFDAVAVNVYTVEVKVDGYYTGTGEDVLTVYDPSLGFTTGGGWFYCRAPSGAIRARRRRTTRATRPTSAGR